MLTFWTWLHTRAHGQGWWSVVGSGSKLGRPQLLVQKAKAWGSAFLCQEMTVKSFLPPVHLSLLPFLPSPPTCRLSFFFVLSLSLFLPFLLTQKHNYWTVWNFFWEVGSRQVIPFSLPLGCHQLCILKMIDKLMNSGMLLKEPCPMSLERKVLTASQPLNPWPLQ